jgi:hypothetical protein
MMIETCLGFSNDDFLVCSLHVELATFPDWLEALLYWPVSGPLNEDPLFFFLPTGFTG